MGGDASSVVLAVDLGGTQLRAALIDRSGQILAREATLTAARGGPDAVIEQMGALAGRLLSGSETGRILGAAVSCPGPLDHRGGHTYAIATLPGFDGFPFVERASARLGFPVLLEHDGHAATFGEGALGAGRGFDDFVYLTVSTGLGGGAVVNGRLMRGAGGMACHFGHMVVDPEGPVCGCGNRGCWEMLASGTAFTERARRRADEVDLAFAGKRGNAIDGQSVFAAACAGDSQAVALIAEEAQWLGIGMVSVMHLFNPGRIVIGGGLSAGFDLLLPGIAWHIERHAMRPFRAVEIVKAELGDNAGLVGAAMLAFEDFP